ncbi:uncharacterized protein LOC119553483 [Drosophila subpulchrella]|uniref:uncharacterized protein LOC119553483 n=1 Tax=Drosophila subpulchrella TaxID=1486046 RepID=UPI0018A1415A|nr:uncharacterized protein LOC119553483 [Drosophila subpulchrella]
MDIKYDEKKWNASNTRMLLTLYSERQADFRNPKRKIKDVWGEMVVALQSQGMTDIDATQLDRKFRNLKKTYYCIKSKHLAKGPQYHPNWQFYDDMTELLKDEPVPWTQVLTMDDYSAMHTFLRDDEAYNPVNEMESGRMLSIGTTVRTVVPRPQKRPYRKRKLAMGETDAKFGRGNKEPSQPTREADPVTVFNAAEPEPSILAESKDELSIATKEDALRHLRALQEYAMFQDNFRAIGLLMQAENAIQYPPKSDDFEVDQK